MKRSSHLRVTRAVVQLMRAVQLLDGFLYGGLTDHLVDRLAANLEADKSSVSSIQGQSTDVSQNGVSFSTLERGGSDFLDNVFLNSPAWEGVDFTAEKTRGT